MYELFAIFAAIFIANVSSDCKFPLNDWPEPTPLILNLKGNSIFYPEEGVVKLGNNERIRLHCVNEKFRKWPDKDEIYVKCVRGNKLQAFSQPRDLKEFACGAQFNSTARRAGSCRRNDTAIDVGYTIAGLYFVKIYTVCMDVREKFIFYSVYEENRLKKGRQLSHHTTYFLKDEFFNYTDLVVFQQDHQREAVGKALKSNWLAQHYIQGDYFLSRGHLSPGGDFVYSFEQDATYHYVNVAPQWFTFNNGNWNLLERVVQTHLSEPYDGRVAIMTGTHGVMTMPDIDGVDRPIYLLDEYRYPVPRFFWKILYNFDTDDGVGFVGVNNPFLENLTRQDTLCQPFEADATDAKKGLVYKCDFIELLNATGNDADVFKKLKL